jgi:hypothetical protein
MIALAIGGAVIAVYAGLFSLLGSLLGAGIAAKASNSVTRRAMEAADNTWSLTNRRDAYIRFLTAAQSLHIACEEQRYFGAEAHRVPQSFVDCFTAYGVIQTAAADLAVVDAARVYAWRLRELRLQLAGKGVGGGGMFRQISVLARDARHATIDVMRTDLGVGGSSRPDASFNPFVEPLARSWKDHQEKSESAETTLVGLPFS